MGPLHRTGSDCFSDADFIAINRSRIDGAISSRDGGSDHFCCFLIWHLPDAEAKLGNYVAVIEANGWLDRHVMVGSVPFLLSSFQTTPSAVRSLQDNYHFLCPITKSDVCSDLGERDYVDASAKPSITKRSRSLFPWPH